MGEESNLGLARPVKVDDVWQVTGCCVDEAFSTDRCDPESPFAWIVDVFSGKECDLGTFGAPRNMPDLAGVLELLDDRSGLRVQNVNSAVHIVVIDQRSWGERDGE